MRATRQTSGNKPYVDFNGVQVEQPDGSVWLAQTLTTPDGSPARLTRQRSLTSRMGGGGSWRRAEGGLRRGDSGGLQRTSSVGDALGAAGEAAAPPPPMRLDDGEGSDGGGSGARVSPPRPAAAAASLNPLHARLRAERASMWAVAQAQLRAREGMDEGEEEGSDVEAAGGRGALHAAAAAPPAARVGGGRAIPPFTR